MIHYKIGNQLNLDEVIELYQAFTLGERRPMQDRDRMRRMLENVNLVLTAWDGELLVGIARSISDFAYCTYVSDLAVRESHQRKGIGRELIRRTQAEAPEATLIAFGPKIRSAGHSADYGCLPGAALHWGGAQNARSSRSLPIPADRCIRLDESNPSENDRVPARGKPGATGTTRQPSLAIQQRPTPPPRREGERLGTETAG
jgi:GNAT superfamily N-acetyltransferase